MRQFIDIVENATSFDPLEDSPTTASQMLIYDLYHDGELYGDNAGMNLVPIDGYTVYLSRVWSNEQGKGHGGRLLKALCLKADELNVTIELEVSPDRDSIMDAESLYDWYSRHGFETDFVKSSQQGATIMVREPSLAEDVIAESKSTPAERFISKAEETLDPNVRISLYPEDDYDVSIQKISVHPSDRGQGLASKALQYLGKMADRRGITLYLEALPDEDDEDMDQDPLRLIRFYQRNGFSGGEADGMMWRSPKVKSSKSGSPLVESRKGLSTVGEMSRKVFWNPSPRELKAMLVKSKYNDLRGGAYLDKGTGRWEIAVWPATSLGHWHFFNELFNREGVRAEATVSLRITSDLEYYRTVKDWKHNEPHVGPDMVVATHSTINGSEELFRTSREAKRLFSGIL